MPFAYQLPESLMLREEDLQDFLRRPLFDGDPLYPMTAETYYEWHRKLTSNTAFELDRFIIGYLHGTDKEMLSFRRAGWDAHAVHDLYTDIEMAAGFDDWMEEKLGWDELYRRTEIGMRRAAVVAQLGRERATVIAASGLSREQLVSIATAPETVRDLPADYADMLYPSAHPRTWEW